MLKHIVMFKFKEGASDEHLRQLTSGFRELKDRITCITAFEHGRNISGEGKDLGFQQVFSLTFNSDRDRDEYLAHPDHVRFVEFVGRTGIVEDVLVVDYRPEA